MSTIQDRYEIGDKVHGLICTVPTKTEARRTALAQQHHQHVGCRVTVYDRMSHIGAIEEWDAWGQPLHTRNLR